MEMNQLGVVTTFVHNIVVYNIPLLYGTAGEIMVEKSGSLNLGVEGIMAVGAIILGIGFGVHMPSMQILVGLSVPGCDRSEAASYQSASGSVGGFISSFVVTRIVSMLGWQPGRSSFVVCVAGYCLMALILFASTSLKRVERI